WRFLPFALCASVRGQSGTITAVVNALARAGVNLGDNGSVIPRHKGKTVALMLSIARLLLAFLPALAGCATTSTTEAGQVQEVEPGKYKVGIAHTVRIGNEKEYEAVSLAGQYCHAKGQKLVIVPTKDNNSVTFWREFSSEPNALDAESVR